MGVDEEGYEVRTRALNADKAVEKSQP